MFFLHERQAMMGCQHRGCLYAPYICTPPYIQILLHTPCTSVCSPYTICSPYVMKTWGHLYTSYVLGSFGGHQYICQAFCICQYIHFPHSSYQSYQLLPLLWVDSLLDWMPMDVFYASWCCSFLCSVFIMSQASTTMAMTTTPQVTVVCSSTSFLLSTVTMAPP